MFDNSGFINSVLSVRTIYIGKLRTTHLDTLSMIFFVAGLLLGKRQNLARQYFKDWKWIDKYEIQGPWKKTAA